MKWDVAVAGVWLQLSGSHPEAKGLLAIGGQRGAYEPLEHWGDGAPAWGGACNTLSTVCESSWQGPDLSPGRAEQASAGLGLRAWGPRATR